MVETIARQLPDDTADSKQLMEQLRGDEEHKCALTPCRERRSGVRESRAQPHLHVSQNLFRTVRRRTLMPSPSRRIVRQPVNLTVSSSGTAAPVCSMRCSRAIRSTTNIHESNEVLHASERGCTRSKHALAQRLRTSVPIT